MDNVPSRYMAYASPRSANIPKYFNPSSLLTSTKAHCAGLYPLSAASLTACRALARSIGLFSAQIRFVPHRQTASALVQVPSVLE